ncbi:Rv1733c family protein [Nocardia cyriacigeorgica]
MSGHPSAPIRIWRMRPWNTNPLMHAHMRFETLAVALLLLASIIAVPIAGAVGTAAYSGMRTRILTDNATKILASVTIADDPVHLKSERRFQATVRWYQDGQDNTLIAPVPHTAERGQQVTVWIGADGTPVDPPRQTSDAVLDGLGAGIAVLCGTWFTATLLIWCGRLLGDHRRRTAWAAEWQQLNHPTTQ